jgi:hypothetical protein
MLMVRLDEARHDDHIGGVNHLGAGCRKIGPDRLDASVADMDIAAR